MILAVCTFTHVNAGLFLVSPALPKKLARAGNLGNFTGFDTKEFCDSVADTVPTRNRFQVSPPKPILLGDPLTRSRCFAIFEPAIWVDHLNAVIYIGGLLGKRKGGIGNCGEGRATCECSLFF
jgi:hypothetical protein